VVFWIGCCVGENDLLKKTGFPVFPGRNAPHEAKKLSMTSSRKEGVPTLDPLDLVVNPQAFPWDFVDVLGSSQLSGKNRKFL
jgi:hypothetical protein